MATGKLNNTEKFAIKGMVTEGKSVAEIAKELGRTEAVVTKYVSTELDGIVETIVQARMQAFEAKAAIPVEEPPFQATVSSEIMIETVHKLKQAGFNKDNAKEMIQRVVNQLSFDPDSSAQLYAICVRGLNSQDLMIKTAAGGRKGVAVMTKAASEKIDSFKEHQPTQGNRKVRECVFQPKEGTMLDG